MSKQCDNCHILSTHPYSDSNCCNPEYICICRYVSMHACFILLQEERLFAPCLCQPWSDSKYLLWRWSTTKLYARVVAFKRLFGAVQMLRQLTKEIPRLARLAHHRSTDRISRSASMQECLQTISLHSCVRSRKGLPKFNGARGPLCMPMGGVTMVPNHKKSKNPMQTTKLVTKPVQMKCLSTPRQGCWSAMTVLTSRGLRDLRTQMNFCIDQVDHGTNNLRHNSYPNPHYIEWMMGYPTDWTEM